MKFYLAGAIYAIALFLLVFALTSNAQTLPTDKFVWEGKVRVVILTPTEIRKKCQNAMYGCWHMDKDTYVMYTFFRYSHTSIATYHETLGHELDHFIRGNFHD